MAIRSCVSKDGRFVVGIHDPGFKVTNLRKNDLVHSLGTLPDGSPAQNQNNFPQGDVEAVSTDRIYEIINPFPFRGVTYINSRWANATANDPATISIAREQEVSFVSTLGQWLKANGMEGKQPEDLFHTMPRPLLLALANVSTDPKELVCLARECCTFVFNGKKTTPIGLKFKEASPGRVVPDIKNHTLFEIIANNPSLPDGYKRVMVLTPGIQGNSEIVGEWQKEGSHVFEYLRTNSYIPWGHFAANTADDTVRYRIKDLTLADMEGMRHLFYQRIFTMLAEEMCITLPGKRQMFSKKDLEGLRLNIIDRLTQDTPTQDTLEHTNHGLAFNGSLWGWNFGFGFAQSGYRLHASHQQIHQQYAMVPALVMDDRGNPFSSYACGDMVADFVKLYKQETGKEFFKNYLKAIQSNSRTSQINETANGPSSLVVHEDENVILFVPKAQTSQWELQLMPKRSCGNILEADTAMRASLDKGILLALLTLESLGARMVTNIEYSKRFDDKNQDQNLVYSFLPRLPHSPGAFSEAQQRWIIGHYPEDFALACRLQLNLVGKE